MAINLMDDITDRTIATATTATTATEHDTGHSGQDTADSRTYPRTVQQKGAPFGWHLSAYSCLHCSLCFSLSPCLSLSLSASPCHSLSLSLSLAVSLSLASTSYLHRLRLPVLRVLPRAHHRRVDTEGVVPAVAEGVPVGDGEAAPLGARRSGEVERMGMDRFQREVWEMSKVCPNGVSEREGNERYRESGGGAVEHAECAVYLCVSTRLCECVPVRHNTRVPPSSSCP